MEKELRLLALEKLAKAREILKDITPLKRNCGRYCDGACCKDDETGENGMLLYPFEEGMYEQEIEGFPFHLAEDDTLYKGGKRLVCHEHCVRDHRPLACRIFPLRMAVGFDEQETLDVKAEIDPRAYCVCPLLEQGGMRAMDHNFIAAVKEVGEILCEHETLREALLQEQAFIDEMRKF